MQGAGYVDEYHEHTADELRATLNARSTDLPVTDEELEARHGFHPATPTTGPMHDEVRARFLDFAKHVRDLTPESREQSLALTALQESMMWANAAIAIRTQVAAE